MCVRLMISVVIMGTKLLGYSQFQKLFIMLEATFENRGLGSVLVLHVIH